MRTITSCTLVSYGGINAQGQYVYTLPTDKFGNYQPQQLQVYDGGFFDPSRVASLALVGHAHGALHVLTSRGVICAA